MATFHGSSDSGFWNCWVTVPMRLQVDNLEITTSGAKEQLFQCLFQESLQILRVSRYLWISEAKRFEDRN